jgi:hypothetical protein
VALVERAVLNSSRRGDTVLDPFAGSGTTLVACEKADRIARLIELEPCYCDVIIARWQELTGREAVYSPTGETFVQLSAKRSVPAEEPTGSAQPVTKGGE